MIGSTNRYEYSISNILESVDSYYMDIGLSYLNSIQYGTKHTFDLDVMKIISLCDDLISKTVNPCHKEWCDDVVITINKLI